MGIQYLDGDKTGNSVVSGCDFLSKDLEFKAYMTVKTSLMVFWVVMLHDLVSGYQCCMKETNQHHNAEACHQYPRNIFSIVGRRYIDNAGIMKFGIIPPQKQGFPEYNVSLLDI